MTIFLITRFNDEGRAMVCFRKAEEILEKAESSMKASILRQLVKARLMIARLFSRKHAYAKSLEILWGCINTLLIECQIRMHEYLDCEPSDSPKMVKWAKYFISTLFQMTTCYIKTQEIEGVLETARMLQWTTNVFFDPRSSYYMSIMSYTKVIMQTFELKLREKNELISFIDLMLRKKFKEEYLAVERRVKAKKVKLKKGGFIPKPSEEEISFLKNKLYFWLKPSEWKIQPIEMIRNRFDKLKMEKIQKDLEMKIYQSNSKSPLGRKLNLSKKKKENSEFLMRSYRKKNNMSISTKNSSLFTIKKHSKTNSMNFLHKRNTSTMGGNKEGLGSVFSTFLKPERSKKKKKSSSSSSYRLKTKDSRDNSRSVFSSSKRSQSSRKTIGRGKEHRRKKIKKDEIQEKKLADIINNQKSHQDCN